jgi:hypothetical protein
MAFSYGGVPPPPSLTPPARELPVQYDPRDDVLTVCGIRYSAHMFRMFALASPGTWMRIEQRAFNDTLTVFHPSEEIERMFDTIIGRRTMT